MQGEIELVVASGHPAFAGHFPGSPILPGVVVLDAAVHAVLQAARAAGLAVEDNTAGACEISSAKFLSPIGPGETLTLCYRSLACGKIHFEILGAGRKVAQGTLLLPPQP